MIYALVVVKEFALAKQRLATALTQNQRLDLTEAMVRDVLTVISKHPEVTQTILLSNEPRANALAREFGIQWWPETSLNLPAEKPDLNMLVDSAAGRFHGDGVETMLVVHADLPLIDPEDIQALIDQHRRLTTPAVTIAADHLRLGSNCLIATPPIAIPAQYGADSLNGHLTVAKQLQVSASVAHLPGLGNDIDRPDDLARIKTLANEHNLTRHYLEKSVCMDDLNTLSAPLSPIVRDVRQEGKLGTANALALADSSLSAQTSLKVLQSEAVRLRDIGFRNVVTYSPKVFLPLTQLCRNVCHYCTFAQTPRKLTKPFMTADEVLAIVQKGVARGCKEALFTLGDKPEDRYRAAREALASMGFDSTIEYVAHIAERVVNETGVLPHINAGCLSAEEIALLRPVSASMGLMLESVSDRLCEKGMPHYGSPDKEPARRLATIERAGIAKVPMTTGILIGIGETRTERVESLLTLRDLHQKYGHIQEIIIQNFRRKPQTKMAFAPEPDLPDLLWTVAVARLIFGAQMSIQAPPNLSTQELTAIIDAGINDWGGVSPVTPDFVNPEAPWPEIVTLANETAQCGKQLQERLTIYPQYALKARDWLDLRLHTKVLTMIDTEGYPRTDQWCAGAQRPPPKDHGLNVDDHRKPIASEDLKKLVGLARAGKPLTENDIVRLFQARGDDYRYVCQQANALRHEVKNSVVTYAVNRNINYTNVCGYKCRFCAFSKGSSHAELRGKPYDLDIDEIARRCREAWDRGATEVCMQGGIHPFYDGNTYLNILSAVREATPDMHIHAFSPLEVWHGAQTLGVTLRAFLGKLRAAGLNTLPGTAAEVLDDSVRADLCPDKINTEQWLEVMETAHGLGIKTTATIMYGHIDRIHHWARHLLKIRELQKRTMGFTEFVPLPFVHMESPIFLRGHARKGPTFREAVLMHAVARLVLHPYIENIQASWVKMGFEGALACLNAGANDLGGTLMNESITRAAGASHGEELSPSSIKSLALMAGCQARQRTTSYDAADPERMRAAEHPLPLAPVINTPINGRQHKGRRLA